MRNRPNTALRRMRISSGLLQVELAEKLGISQSSLSAMEKNGLKRLDRAVKIASVLDCEVEKLLDIKKGDKTK